MKSFSILQRQTALLRSTKCSVIPRQLTLVNRNAEGIKCFSSSGFFFRTSLPNRGIITFKLADIGEGIAEVEMLKWHKNVGDQITEMDATCEVQSDKAAVEISSRYTGKVVKLHAQVGDIVKIGAPLMDIDADGEGDEEHSSPSHIKEEEKSSQTESAPSHSKEASHPKDSPPSHPPSKEAKSEGSGEPSGHLYSPTLQAVRASPASRALAREHNIDLRMVKPSGHSGIVTKEDILNFRSSGGSSPSSPREAPQEMGKGEGITKRRGGGGGEMKESVPIKGFAKAMVKSMTESLKVPHMSIQEDCDITNLLNIRKDLKTLISERDPTAKLTITPFVIKAVSMALRQVPILNSKFDTNEKYNLYHNHNISLAIDTPNGLIVPNIKNVETLTLMEVQHELTRLQQLAKSNKLGKEDLTGGTISVSNVGVIGGVSVVPILFDGQAAILGLGRVQVLPRYSSDKSVLPRSIMSVTASVDHRHVDGATVARFMSGLRQYLEHPELMLLESV